MNEIDYLDNFSRNSHNLFYDIILNKGILTKDSTDALTHALVDISKSIKEIYSIIIPKILQNPNENKDFILDLLWDIREEFKHIQYHIDDAKLTEL